MYFYQVADSEVNFLPPLVNPLSGVAVEFFVKSGQTYFAPEEGVMIADMNSKAG